MKKMNLIGIEDEIIEIYQKSASFLYENYHGVILTDLDSDIFVEIFDILKRNFSPPRNFRISNIIELSFKGKNVGYIAFLVIDLGMTFNRKYGQKDAGFDYQVWGYLPKMIEKDFGNIIPREGFEQPWIANFFRKFMKRRKEFKNQLFNRKYEVIGDFSTFETRLNPNVIAEIVKFDDFNIGFTKSGIVAGFFSDISESKVIGISKLFSNF